MAQIGLRYDKKVEAYLKEVANKNDLLNASNTEPSVGLAAKEIIKWCMKNKVDISKNIDDFEPDTKKMIEQIHVAIPHILMLGRMNLQPLIDATPDDKVREDRAKAVEYVNNTCGAFQNIHYENIRVSLNHIGMKQAPESKETTQWK